MIYQDLVQSEDKGIYTALFDSLKEPNISDLTNTYITVQQLDARFAFENNMKEVYFTTLAMAVDVLTAKYLTKWTALISGILKNSLPNGASQYQVSSGNNTLNNTNTISAYDSDAMVNDNGSNASGSSHNETTTYDLTGQEFVLTLYNNNNVYDIINTDIRKTLFKNVYILKGALNESNTDSRPC